MTAREADTATNMMPPLPSDRRRGDAPLSALRRAALAAACVFALAGCAGGGGNDTESIQRAASGSSSTAAATKEPAGGWEALLPPANGCPGQDEADAPSAELRDAAICVIDHVRQEQGLDALSRSSTLQGTASSKADDLVRCEEFSHTACDRDTGYWFDELGYLEECSSGAYAENLGVGGGRLGRPREIVLSWLESKGHRRNLLSDRWSEQAIAVERVDSWEAATGGSRTTFRDANVWVSHFGVTRGC